MERLEKVMRELSEEMEVSLDFEADGTKDQEQEVEGDHWQEMG